MTSYCIVLCRMTNETTCTSMLTDPLLRAINFLAFQCPAPDIDDKISSRSAHWKRISAIAPITPATPPTTQDSSPRPPARSAAFSRSADARTADVIAEAQAECCRSWYSETTSESVASSVHCGMSMVAFWLWMMV